MSAPASTGRREYELLRAVARLGVLLPDGRGGDGVILTGLEVLPRWLVPAAQVEDGIERGWIEVDEGSRPPRLRLTPSGLDGLRELARLAMESRPRG